MRCPVCGRDTAPRTENPQHPFCSERCKLLDLGNWLGETYRIPAVEPPSGPDLGQSENGNAPGEEDDR